jgi:hypothetical protein
MQDDRAAAQFSVLVDRRFASHGALLPRYDGPIKSLPTASIPSVKDCQLARPV